MWKSGGVAQAAESSSSPNSKMRSVPDSKETSFISCPPPIRYGFGGFR